MALVEVLVSLAVLATGMAGLLRLQTGLRASADLSHQRSVALRLAQDDLEALRAAPSPADAAAGGTQTLEPTAATATYTLNRRVQPVAWPGLTQVQVELAWADRHGRAQSLQLDTLLAGLDPALSGALLLARGAAVSGTVAQNGNPGAAAPRQPLIPAEAQALGDGRSAYQPRAADTLIWVFDDATGQVVARCDAAAGVDTRPLTATALGTCRAMAGLFISGRVRFATDTHTPGRAEAENPLSPARDLDMSLQLTGNGDPTRTGWECRDDSTDVVAAGGTVVRYLCVIQDSGLPPQWSGRLDVVPQGWALAAASGGPAEGALRVCRYSADHDGNGRIDNAEHPARHSQVAEALGEQNFLVIRAAAACPQDRGATTGPEANTAALHDNWIDDSTVPHAP
jgi:Tfp pilus assembly protein PilV